MEQPRKPAERRRKKRFRMALPIQFSALSPDLQIEGEGNVVDISSAGVAFRSEMPVPEGALLRASVAWPTWLNAECALRLVVQGKVVRVEGTLAVLAIERYEFRTARRRKPDAGSPEVQEATRVLDYLVSTP